MTVFVKPTLAPVPRSKQARFVAVGFAAILVGIVLTQLFTFDHLVELLPSIGLPFSGGFQYAIAPLIVVAEVFALPFLLTMTVSIAFRWLSMFCGWVAALAWIGIGSYLLINGIDAANTGLLGTVVEMGSLATLIVGLLLALLAAWSAWGLWPLRSATKVIEK